MLDPGSGELQIELSVWNDVVREIPDQWLNPSWQKAAEDHDWSNPFRPDFIRGAYKALILEDRERIRRERFNSVFRSPNTFVCWMCEDQGYTVIRVYCPSTRSSRRVARPCACSMTPLSQRQFSIVDTADWKKNQVGEFEWAGQGQGLPCNCSFCQRGNNESAKNSSNNQNAQHRQTGPNVDYSDGEEYL